MLTLAAILCIIVFAPLAMGSVYIIAYTLMGGIVFAALGVHVARDTFWRSSAMSGEWPFAADRRLLVVITPFVVFLVVGLFQMIPLPAGILHFLSPGTLALYGKLGLDKPGYVLPLTVSTALTTIALLKWFAYGGLFLLMVTWSPCIGSAEDQRWLLLPVYAIFAVGFIESVYGLYSAVNHSESLFWFTRKHNIGIVSGTYINPDHLAGLLDMAIPVSVGLFLYHWGVLRKRYGACVMGFVALLGSRRALGVWLLFLGITIMILAHTFTLSRMGHLSIITAFAFVAILYGKRRSKTPIVATIALIFAGMLWAAWEGLGVVVDKWGMLENGFQGRYEVWRGALSVMANYPAFGTGLGTFPLAYPPYKAADFGATMYDHAHNDYVEMLTDTGLAGFIPWIAFFFVFLLFVIRDWFRNDSFFTKTLGAGCIAAVIAALLHSLADFNLQIPANPAILFVIMGITWRVVRRRSIPLDPPSSIQRSVQKKETLWT